MNLIEFLEKSQDKVVAESIDILNRANLKHYTLGGPENTKQKLDALYNVIYQSIKEKNLIPIVSYIDKMAEKRFESGFELQEVQTAINVVEESIWKRILEELPADEQPKALSLVSSIVGSGKDTLARTYVVLTREQGQEGSPESSVSSGSSGSSESSEGSESSGSSGSLESK